MGTMLITRSTPKITYKIGMRNVGASDDDWDEDEADSMEDGSTEDDDSIDASLPMLGSEAPAVEVAADVTGIYRILMLEEAAAE
jgi:hypothetical protein